MDPEEHPRGFLHNRFDEPARVLRLALLKLRKACTTVEVGRDEMFDVMISEILEHEARVRLEGIFKDNPWSARNTDFDVCRGNNVSEQVDQIHMIPAKLIKSINKETELRPCYIFGEPFESLL
jgi:hypothetical protein